MEIPGGVNDTQKVAGQDPEQPQLSFSFTGKLPQPEQLRDSENQVDHSGIWRLSLWRSAIKCA